MKRSDSGTFKEEDLQIGKHGLLIHGESPRTPLRQGGKLLFNRNMNEWNKTEIKRMRKDFNENATNCQFKQTCNHQIENTKHINT